MAKNIKKEIRTSKDISYLNKDFDSFRTELIRYANVFYPDKILDFTESGLGGLFVDMAAYVGDVMSFYLDHQFNETNLETAVQDENIERLVRAAGVKIVGASPAIVPVEFTITAPAEFYENEYRPKINTLPKIRSGTILGSKNGINFTLMEDLDFAKVNASGNLIASVAIATSSNNAPLTYTLKLTGVCTSSLTRTQSVTIENNFRAFRTVLLSQSNINEIISVYDSDGNEYYEVDNLTQDVVFLRKDNLANDQYEVQERLELVPAPYRFVRIYNRQNNTTSLRFGSGRQDVFDDDVIPDPSEHSIPLYGDRKTLDSIAIDPNSFLETATFGISPNNTTLTIRYRYGGGLSHNVGPLSINSVKDLIMDFPSSVETTDYVSVRRSTAVSNLVSAKGGEDPPTLDDLRFAALSAGNSQNRIVSKQDLIARVYSMPSKFGRVYRAAVRPNRNNPLAALLYVVSRDASGKLLQNSPDSLKENLATYLNEFRMVSDAIDIMDSPICNIGIKFSVSIERNFSPQAVLGQVIQNIISYMQNSAFQIDQPISISDIVNIIINVDGVISLIDLQFKEKSGLDSVTGNSYSQFNYSVASNTSRGMIFPADGGIFELKYPEDDVVGEAV